MSESPDTAHTMNSAEQTPPLPGEILRAEREARGLTVHQVASELHVADRLLDALENNDFDAIGAAIFVKGHLRNYARLLGLEPGPLLDAYDHYAHPAPPELVGRRPEGIPVENDSGGPLLKIAGWLFIVILLLATAGWWYYQQDSVQGVADRIDILMSPDDEVSPGTQEADTDDTEITEPLFADRLAAAEKAAAGRDEQEADPRATVTAPGEEQPGSPGQATDQETTAAREEAGTSDTVSSVPESESTETSSSSGEVVTEDGALERTPAESPVIEENRQESRPGTVVATGYMQLEFNEASWAEVYNTAGDALLYDLVPAGTTHRIAAAGEVRVFLGNAPAVDITLNGDAFDTEQYIRRDNTARFRIDLTPVE